MQKFLLILLIYLLPILSNVTIASPVTKNSKAVVNVKMVCYFLFDNKYAEKNDSIEELKWIDSKLSQLTEFNTVNKLFNHENGGPNGAIWNGNADIYVFAVYDTIFSDSDISIKLNNKPLKKSNHQVFTSEKLSIVYFKIKNSVWEKQLRPI
ncbi:MAG: hypothetical protein IPO21_09005 [Bacteroidales bacterium]|nr:hypothetical protein [Bacteroidales bacterium]